jgi:DNA-binding response OmpR family regulator
VDEKIPDLGVGIGDEDACGHEHIIGSNRANDGVFRYVSGMSAGRVLVVDDDPDIRDLVAELLGRAGYTVATAADGREGLRAMYSSQPDLVVLDVSMPGLDGWQTLERIRDLSDVPVLMLTARGSELEKVRGLQSGADDYVTKPFGRQELLARVGALLRRGRAAAAPVEVYDDGYVAVDFRQRQVLVEGSRVSLTPLEFKLLAAFVRHRGQVLSREQLLELAWGDPLAVSPDQVKIYVGYLRRKLGASSEGGPIETVRGFGYRYRPPGSE